MPARVIRQSLVNATRLCFDGDGDGKEMIFKLNVNHYVWLLNFSPLCTKKCKRKKKKKEKKKEIKKERKKERKKIEIFT
jgi:hypothetical protein